MNFDYLNQGYFPTGFPDLDELTGGFNRKRLLTFASVPGGGMTTALTTIAAQAIRDKVPTLFVDTESTREALLGRLTAALSGVEREALRGEMTTADRDKARLAAEMIEAAPFTVDVAAQSINEVLAQAMDAKPRLVLIDGTRLLDATRDGSLAEAAVERVVRLKRMAGSQDAAFCVTHPLGRSSRPELEPEMQPFMDHSDQVVLISSAGWPEAVSGTRMDVCKNRSGPTGGFNVTADFKRSRFVMAQ